MRFLEKSKNTNFAWSNRPPDRFQPGGFRPCRQYLLAGLRDLSRLRNGGRGRFAAASVAHSRSILRGRFAAQDEVRARMQPAGRRNAETQDRAISCDAY